MTLYSAFQPPPPNNSSTIMRFLNILVITVSLSGLAKAAEPTSYNSATISGLGARNIGSATMSGRISAIEARYGAAEASFRRARRVAEAIGDTQLVGWARSNLAAAQTDQCDFAAAEAELREALPAVGWTPFPMATLARVLLRTGRIEEGKAFADAAVTRAEREGLLEPLPWALIQAGEARFAEGDLDGATERFT